MLDTSRISQLRPTASSNTCIMLGRSSCYDRPLQALAGSKTLDESVQTILRVFISSPGDVRPERLITERVVQRLDREFASHLRVNAVMWEREPLLASDPFQTNITPPHETDIVVVILWSRLGLPLSIDDFPGPLSRKQVTGTEWEFEDALKCYRENKRPDILMYRKKAEVTGVLNDRDAVRRRLEQMDQANDFYKKWFVDEKALLPSAASWPFRDTAEFEEILETHLRELIRRRIDRTAGIEVQTATRYPGNPFRGLLSFELKDAAVFFGRTRARNELRELLARQADRGSAFVLVFGASGSGKSSLVKAGLLADLIIPGMIGRVALVRYTVMRPSDRGGALIEALAAAMIEPTEALPELAAPPLADNIETLAALLRDAPRQATRPIRQGLAVAGRAAGLSNLGDARLVVVIDQLEELFTQDNVPAAEREVFVTALGALATSGLVWVIATMRSDFFHRVETMPALASLSAGEARFLLLPPDAAEIGQIIRQPAREAGLRFEVDTMKGVGLDETIRQATVHDMGALPLLSFLLDQLWRRRSASGVLTFAAYHELGGLEGAVGRRAEEVFLGQPQAVQNELVPVLRALVTVTDGKATSQSAPLWIFPTGSPRRRLVEALLDPEARLLVADGDSDGARVRLAHEALLTHWPRARDQITADARDLELRGQLEREAERWRDASRQHRASLVRAAGMPLAEALALRARWGAELPSEVTEFVAASQRVARRKRLRLIASLVGAMAALPVIAAIVWAAMVGRGVRAVEAEMEFVSIPAGCFEMGSPLSEPGRRPNEGPEGPVPGFCPKALELGKFEVTQAQWRRVMIHDPDPSVDKGDQRPVESVTWTQAELFVFLMNAFGRRHYRLPSETEWEYAARGQPHCCLAEQKEPARYWGGSVDDGCAYENLADRSLKKQMAYQVVANCDDGFPRTAPVGQKKPNPFGLYDMLGNVAEWVEDCYVEDIRELPKDGSAAAEGKQNCYCDEYGFTHRVLRGSDWWDNPGMLRAAIRRHDVPSLHDNLFGFRLARL
jgi:formylglycine-generating enzyme required for sulfatase activity